ncbi:hypothetical protein BH10PSE13_BH10PSE13_19190 [soil metagenome]
MMGHALTLSMRMALVVFTILLGATGAMARAERSATPAQAHARALTSQQLSERGLLGRYQGLDPELYGRIWRSGRDPRTCRSAQFFALAYRNAIGRLTRDMNAAANRDGSSEGETLNREIEIADMLEFNGRYGDAERFLNQRIATRLTHANGTGAAARLQSLRQRLATLYTITRPDEAERMLTQITAAQQADAQALFAAQVHGYPAGGDVWQYWNKFRTRQSSGAAERVLAPFYRSTGRLTDAMRLYQAALAPLEADARETAAQNNAIGPPAGLEDLRLRTASLRAEIAEKAGRFAEAEAAYRDCCGASSAFARLLLREGKREEARIVLARMMIVIGTDIEERFDCMKTPTPADGDAAIASAKATAQRLAADPSVYLVQEDGYNGGYQANPTTPLIESAANLARATELGELLIEAGLYDDARDVLLPTFGIQMVMLGANHPDALRSLAALAHVVRLLGKPDAAVALWSRWQQLGAEFLTSRLWSVAEDDRRRFFRDDRRNIDQFLAAIRESAPANGAEEVLTISLGHKGQLASVAGQIDARARTRSDPQIVALRSQLRQLRTQFAAFALHDQTAAPAATLTRRKIDDVEAQLAALIGMETAATQPATPAALIATLRPGEALVDFLSFHDPDAREEAAMDRLVAVIARPDTPPQMVWWTDIAPVRAAAARFRAAILSDEDDARRAPELQESGRALSALVWKPIASHLAGISRILFGPDDVLDVVPLAAMPDDQGKPLVQSYQLIALSAPRDLLPSPVEGRASTALVVGNPAFGAMPGAVVGARGVNRVIATRGDQIAFGPLPGTLAESSSVNALLAKSYASQLLQGPAATKTAVSAVRSPAILHLATHGFFLTGLTGSTEEGDALVSLSRSGLALANANIGIRTSSSVAGADGILTALEAVSLDLRGTKLVVLSACETALGEIASGEGVYGLAQALHQSGARTVLATLWPVSDDATSAFMQQFYTNIAAGDDPQQALHKTQLAFMQSSQWHDPIFWGPFVLTGR